MKQLVIRNRNTRKDRAIRLMREVCRELRWTEFQYNTHQFETGMAYLEEYLNHDTYSVCVMECSAIFWNWWKNHYTNRDENFLEQIVNTTFTLEEQRDMYADMHDAATLAKCIYPNGVVLNESYASMVSELIKQETQLP